MWSFLANWQHCLPSKHSAMAIFQGSTSPFHQMVCFSCCLYPCIYSCTEEGQGKALLRIGGFMKEIRWIFHLEESLLHVQLYCEQLPKWKVWWDFFFITLHFLLIQIFSICLLKALTNPLTINHEIQLPSQHPPFKEEIGLSQTQ